MTLRRFVTAWSSLWAPLVLFACASTTPTAPSNVGAVSGTVFGTGGKAQPIGRAVVSIGALSTLSANPTGTVEADADDGAASKTVLHDFNDGKGSVLTQRVLTHPGGSISAGEGRYTYLRLGDYYIEGVPPGLQTIAGTVPGLDSDGITHREYIVTTQVMVLAGTVTKDVNLRVNTGPTGAESTPFPSGDAAATPVAVPQSGPSGSDNPVAAGTSSAAPGTPRPSGTTLVVYIPPPSLAPSPAPSVPASPTAAPTPTPTPTPVAASFKSSVVPLLSSRCAACHTNPGSGDLSLFGAGGTADYALIRSKIGDIADSVRSGRMPRGGAAFTAAEIKVLTDWSAAGTPNN